MEPRIFTYQVAVQGDPLILVPGGLTGWFSWIPHQERLKAHHRVIRVQPIHISRSLGKERDRAVASDQGCQGATIGRGSLLIELPVAP